MLPQGILKGGSAVIRRLASDLGRTLSLPSAFSISMRRLRNFVKTCIQQWYEKNRSDRWQIFFCVKLKLKWTPLLQENRVLNITNNSTQQNMLHLFNTTDQVHDYNTRSSSRSDYEIKFPRRDKRGKSFSRLGAKIWNCIKKKKKNPQSTVFKRKYMIAYFKSIHRQTTILI